MFPDATLSDIEQSMQLAEVAASAYKKYSLEQRATLLREIADELELHRAALIDVAEQETHLSPARLNSELSRTIFQLISYGEFCASGQWMDIRIDTALPERIPPRPDLRKMLVPLGPVVVFGAGNFPFAYSTAGGDTACALAAGCPVIVKGHPGHAETSVLVAGIVSSVMARLKMPAGLFIHLHGASASVGEALVKHPTTKAVGFTGSFAGGKQLFDWGNQRKIPIPVFAEMSSVNPVFILPGKMKSSAADMARQLAASVSLSVGQFCTNPGVMVAMDNEDLQLFIETLKLELAQTPDAKMLNEGIAKNYADKKKRALAQPHTELLHDPHAPTDPLSTSPTIASIPAAHFIDNPKLQAEVFGPYSILVRCTNVDEMAAVAAVIEGQLTCSIFATGEEIIQHGSLLEGIKNICGRLIFNGVPTGVEVCLAMQHGGPFPSTTDSRFTSVGADGIKRFARPVTYQNWPDHLLPAELRNDTPAGIWRTINNVPSTADVTN